MKLIRAGAALAAVALLAAGLSHGGVAQAQIYPTPQGHCSITPSEATPDLGDTISLLVAVTNLAGSPVAGVSGEAFIVSQPGADASVTPTSFTTDAAGSATLALFTGSTAGSVQVAVVIDDEDLEAECAIDILLDEVAEPAEAAPVAAAAPGPPPTGMGSGSAAGITWQPWAIIAGIVGLGVVAFANRRRFVRS